MKQRSYRPAAMKYQLEAAIKPEQKESRLMQRHLLRLLLLFVMYMYLPKSFAAEVAPWRKGAPRNEKSDCIWGVGQKTGQARSKKSQSVSRTMTQQCARHPLHV